MNVLLSVLVRRTSKDMFADSQPVRTCVGCRTRAQAGGLLRVVVTPPSDASAHTGQAFVVVDERRRRPGRGAWVHPNPECVALAEKRRAFGRALRLTGLVDAAAVRDYVNRMTSHTEVPAGAVAPGGRPIVSRK